MSAPLGQLGRYQIVKHLANGGMAQVLLALATGIENFSRHVVIKRIHKERAADPQFVKMFLDEARLAATLHHNNIVQVHDIGQEAGEYFFTMEYVHGEDLRRLLMEVSKRKQKVPIEHIITIVMAAASALHYAHEMRGPDRKPLQLVHRDVSPANILVGYDGNVKVVDFGIAKAAALRTTETQGGTLKGKVSYMAPEQCAGQAVDRRSDVYALGIVLYELTTVRRLFKGDNDFLTMSAIVQGNIPKPSKHRPDIPAELEHIIMKALSTVPVDRYQSANEMRAALDKFAAKHNLRTSTSGLADYMKSVFGEKPEPWLTDDDPDMELTVDFDGSASGLADVPRDVESALAIPQLMDTSDSAPIVRARTKAITNSPNPGGTIRMTPPPPRPISTPLGRPTPPPMPAVRRATPATGVAMIGGDAGGDVQSVAPPRAITASEIAHTTGWGATDATPTSASGTAMSWPRGTDATVNPAHARRRILLLAGSVAVASLIAILVFVFRGTGSGPAPRETAPAIAPAVEPPMVEAPKVEAPKVEPPAVEPPVVEPPKVEPPVVEPTAETVGAGSAESITPPDATGSGSAIKDASAGPGSGSATPIKKKKRVPVKKTWSPNDLFPK